MSIDSPSNEVMTVGKITGCYGIKGWVKVHSYTEPQENFLKYRQWHVKRRGELEPLVFDQVKSHGKGLVAHIEGVDDRTQAESFKGLVVLVSEAQLPDLEEGDYYWRQLQGLAVWCRNSEAESEVESEAENEPARVLLGEVAYLIETGANDVLVVKASEGSIDDRERLIPYLPDNTVLSVDLEEGLIEVDWFLDEE